MIAHRIKVEGRVQGVFFRASTRDKAIELDLKGWVRNEDDGSVLIQAQGAPEAMEAFVTWCHKGPMMAKVTEVTVEDIHPTEITDFTICY